MKADQCVPRQMRLEREVAGQAILVRDQAQGAGWLIVGLTMRPGPFLRDKEDVRALALAARALADEADVLLGLLEGRQ